LLELIAYTLSSKVKTRKDLELWVGSLAVTVLMVFTAFASLNRGASPGSAVSSVLSSGLMCGFCGAGPLVLFLTWFLFSGGIREYTRLIERLTVSGRVCHVCGVVALYGDKTVDASKRKKQTRSDLVPHMNTIREDSLQYVLCDKCLVEVSAIDSV